MTRTLLALASCLISGTGHAGPEQAGAAPEPAHALPEHKSLEELFPDAEPPALWIGSDAPELTLSRFVRGEAVTSFEPGQTYVVEMWATWCAPCIAAFPHVAALQNKHGDKLRVIGVNIWEGSDGESRADEIEEFVANHPEMRYTVAIEQGTSMADNWMKPSGRDGIPTAFIVDGTGKLMWMGHPMAMDEPLDQIINGGYDVEAVTAKKWNGHLASMAWSQMLISAHEGKADRLFEVCKTLVYDGYRGSPFALNHISLRLLEYADATKGILGLAYDAAERACELTEWRDWMILDTYALAAFKNGDRDRAIEWQRKAIELAPDTSKPELQPQLDLILGGG